MNWTKLLNDNLENILPVRHVVREPGIQIEFGNSRRVWRADYKFSLDGSLFIVEAKLADDDVVLNGTKVMAYQRLFNIQTGYSCKPLIIARKSKANAADFMACAMLRISLLTIDFKEL